MFGNRNSNVRGTQSGNSTKDSHSTMGVVYDVILDINHTIFDDREIAETERTKYIGGITYRLFTKSNKSESELGIAFPTDLLITSLPLKNEKVEIITSAIGVKYKRISQSNTPNINSLENTITTLFKPDSVSTETGKDYQNTADTGIPNSNNDTSNKYDGYGKYFTETKTIHKLKLYEGDTLLESRFGQSLRFSGYNNSENVFSPTITIRNGENPETISDINPSVDIDENVNKDGNIIFLGSGDRLLEYVLPTEVVVQSFFNYPNELKGNQILLNSDRIIISAKTQEMIFSSKGNVGFMTDNQFSIDTMLGINITSEDNIEIDTTAEDTDIKFNIGDNNIYLGTDDDLLEPAVKGDTLHDLLDELIQLIEQQVFLTPSGPSATGPVNLPSFTALRNKLETMKSANIQLK